MHQMPSFAANLISVILGVLFLMANAAFVLVPYGMSGHPGEASAAVAAGKFHPT